MRTDHPTESKTGSGCLDVCTLHMRPCTENLMFKHKLRILLVEDHPFQLIATQILLNNQGYFLLTPVLDAAEALMAMERAPTPYDLLLCDQGLPDLSGFDLIEQASQRGMVRKAIILSSLSGIQLQALEEQAIGRGVPLLGCLTKPLQGPELARLLSLARHDT